MKIKSKDNTRIIEQVYSNCLMRTDEGNEISICMRDDSFEINVMPQGKHINNWWRVDMKTGTIVKEVITPPVKDTDPVSEGGLS